MQKEKRKYNKRVEPERGGKVMIQVDVFSDQPPMIKKYIEKNGGSVASTVRVSLDAMLKPDYE